MYTYELKGRCTHKSIFTTYKLYAEGQNWWTLQLPAEINHITNDSKLEILSKTGYNKELVYETDIDKLIATNLTWQLDNNPYKLRVHYKGWSKDLLPQVLFQVTFNTVQTTCSHCQGTGYVRDVVYGSNSLSNRQFNYCTGLTKASEELRKILLTSKGESTLTNYGSAVYDYIGQPLDQLTLLELQRTVIKTVYYLSYVYACIICLYCFKIR